MVISLIRMAVLGFVSFAYLISVLVKLDVIYMIRERICDLVTMTWYMYMEEELNCVMQIPFNCLVSCY